MKLHLISRQYVPLSDRGGRVIEILGVWCEKCRRLHTRESRSPILRSKRASIEWRTSASVRRSIRRNIADGQDCMEVDIERYERRCDRNRCAGVEIPF